MSIEPPSQSETPMRVEHHRQQRGQRALLNKSFKFVQDIWTNIVRLDHDNMADEGNANFNYDLDGEVEVGD